MAIGIATTLAMYHEGMIMIAASPVQLADPLLMFLYLEVLAMIGQYFKFRQLPVRFPYREDAGEWGAEKAFRKRVRVKAGSRG